MNYLPIEDYGIVGDLNTVALVGINGSIDYMCYPYLDSPSIFAAMLDRNRGGFFSISPYDRHDKYTHRQLYLPDTNILLTRFLSDEGVVEICDFMPINDGPGKLIRRVSAIRGKMRIWIGCDPRFDYGRVRKFLQLEKDGTVVFTPHSEESLPTMCLRNFGSGRLNLRIRNGAAVGVLHLDIDQEHTFIFECSENPIPEADANAAFQDTVNYWHGWVAQSTYRGRWREMVIRSALVLKLLTSRKYGSVAAAATYGLPEEIGGERNYDYRFTWIRDASFTVHALLRLGFYEEAIDFMNWVQNRCIEAAAQPRLSIMYQLSGRQDLEERILAHFEGYRKSPPVRIGNAAYDQLQHDIYGELMDAVFLCYRPDGLTEKPIGAEFWAALRHLIDHVCNIWFTEDAGIWEVRGKNQHFLYSRLMCWVALDRAVQLAGLRGLDAPLDHWRQKREDIHRNIIEEFWDDELNSFVQYKGSKAVDASSLLMPIVKFIPNEDERWQSTLKRIEEKLVDDSLVFRYDVNDAAHDGFDGGEATFNLCTFWYVECLARGGQVEKARLVFEKMLTYASHLGLYAEETGRRGEQLGNFPQAFTHLGLISAATYLDWVLDEGLEPDGAGREAEPLQAI